MDEGQELRLGRDDDGSHYFLGERRVRAGEFLELRLPGEIEWTSCRFSWPFIPEWLPTIVLHDGQAVEFLEGAEFRWPLGGVVI